MKALSIFMLTVAAAGMLACSGNETKYVITGKNAPQDGVVVYLVDRIVADAIDSATSLFDYAFTRKWSDVFTVVTWDQRGCGKSFDKSRPETITAEIMMSDGKVMTEYIRDLLHVDKITLLGHSWGSYLGANLALEYPQYYEAFIGTGQFIDWAENERRLYEAALEWSKNDSQGCGMVEKWGWSMELGEEDFVLRNSIMDRYGYGMMKDGRDYSLFMTVLCNPYYSRYNSCNN